MKWLPFLLYYSRKLDLFNNRVLPDLEAEPAAFFGVETFFTGLDLDDAFAGDLAINKCLVCFIWRNTIIDAKVNTRK